MEIRVDNLSRHFGRTRAVDGISFTFGSGQIVGFIGPNGAGKTTTMRILATADEPTEGDAFIDGASVVQEPEKVRARVGFMPDYLPGHRDISVHEYLDFFARAYGIPSHRRRAVVEQVEEFTNLNDLRQKTVATLSKGMKQRVSLARAMVHDPAVLILDEPASGLDPRARIELRELLRALAERGKAILISSHILTELSEICGATVIIEQGKIVRAGTMAEIVARDAPLRSVLVRTRGSLDDLHKAVLQLPRVRAARIAGAHVEVDIEGDDEVCQTLLAELVRQGLPIVEFACRKTGLEEIFMNVTKGKVQ
jgi:ABC-2 type transport system ATP-binding protein